LLTGASLCDEDFVDAWERPVRDVRANEADGKNKVVARRMSPAQLSPFLPEI
jgi:hypothetical protein